MARNPAHPLPGLGNKGGETFIADGILRKIGSTGRRACAIIAPRPLGGLAAIHLHPEERSTP